MSSFADRDRDRLSLVEAQRVVANSGAWIAHLLSNDDGTYSIMKHINCEWCDYCSVKADFNRIHVAKQNPYENMEKLDLEQ